MAGLKASERLFIASLLHCVGRLFHAQASPKLFEQCCEKAAAGEISFACAERETFGHETTALTALLLERWSIPAAIRDIACNAATPDDSEEHRDEALLLNLSRSLVAACRLGTNGEFLIPPPHQSVSDLNLPVGSLEKAALELKAQLRVLVTSLLD